MGLEDLQQWYAIFFSRRGKIRQDTKLSHLLDVCTTKRKRSRKLQERKHHNLSVKNSLWIGSPLPQGKVNESQTTKSIKYKMVERRGGDDCSHKNTDKGKK